MFQNFTIMVTYRVELSDRVLEEATPSEVFLKVRVFENGLRVKKPVKSCLPETLLFRIKEAACERAAHLMGKDADDYAAEPVKNSLIRVYRREAITHV